MAKGLRPAKCYHWDSPAYSRISGNPSDSFITGIPSSKIVHFDMGNLTGKFDTEVSIVSKQRIQIRHNALEATRILVHKYLEESLGINNYRLKVRIFPHHVMRENTMATGAGADRIQDGMRRSFGKPIGMAARIKKGQAVFSVYINEDEKTLRKVKSVLTSAIKKLPGEMSIVIQPVKKLKK